MRSKQRKERGRLCIFPSFIRSVARRQREREGERERNQYYKKSEKTGERMSAGKTKKEKQPGGDFPSFPLLFLSDKGGCFSVADRQAKRSDILFISLRFHLSCTSRSGVFLAHEGEKMKVPSLAPSAIAFLIAFIIAMIEAAPYQQEIDQRYTIDQSVCIRTSKRWYIGYRYRCLLFDVQFKQLLDA